jgi:hypothetical protein
MVVVNTNRSYASGYPDVNPVPGCCNYVNKRGPYVGLSGLNTNSLMAVAAVYATLFVLDKMTKGQGFFSKILPS